MDQQTLLSDTPKNLIEKYRKVLKANNVAFDKMIVFGSFAKKTQHMASDLDVCVVSKEFGKDAFAEMIMLAKYAAQVDSLIEPHPYSPQDLADKWDPLAHEIRIHGIIIQ
ncbi:TPA: nucleotidyltransferase domain-containing protein [Patescibacteria group bacterium]|uniref:Polymerase, beta domain protein region protein n=1 Tax=Candidatus Gottesmanbacteria bacterium GW2011_GWA1_43_11 TaxID=1618436 RepID=A0A0G1CKL4_9BACT|nr:MAG: polymerase, beta domain protein region protein [Candidatus Gottesmanbacteria bacterium GW2011_GWA1_43_11]HCS78125.1 nucleotidyltransferase domain-containing protein [Patescibacteria group bacterium]